MKTRALRAFLLIFLLLFASVSFAETAPELNLPRSEAALTMMNYLESDPELMAMMEKSIAAAAAINPDPSTNPVQSVDQLYDFIDWAVTCMPWNVLTDASYPALYDHIDQGVCYFWFLVDQPLPELEGKGYYYPSLQYHEPIAGWCRQYSDEWGAFLSTEDSWNDLYYQRIKNDPTMNMQYGWYADTNVWHSFNEWFSRYLIDPSVRPVADSTVVAPADSRPEGIWAIDENGDLVQKEGVDIKSANFTSIAQLIGERLSPVSFPGQRQDRRAPQDSGRERRGRHHRVAPGKEPVCSDRRDPRVADDRNPRLCHHRYRGIRAGGGAAHRHVPDLLLQLGGRPGGRLRRSERGSHGVFPFRRKRHRDGVPGRCGCGIPV